MELFEIKIQPSTISVVQYLTKKRSMLDVRIRSEYASGAINYFYKGSILMFECVLDTPLTCFRKDKNCEKPVTE